MDEQEDSLRWIESGGGPLILLSGEYLLAWSGLEPATTPPEGADPSTLPPTDYERACFVLDQVGLVPVLDGQGLVLGDEPLSTAWWEVSPTEGILVRWVYGVDDERVIDFLDHVDERVPDRRWKPNGLTFSVGTLPLYLFDTAWPGREVNQTEYLTCALEPGDYAVDTAVALPDADTEVLLHRLRRQ